jgi:MFS family permease
VSATEPDETTAGADEGVVPGLACAIATVSIVGVGLSLTMTLLAVRLAEQGYSARAIGLNPTAAGVATLIGAAFVPTWARRLGVKGLLVVALLVSGASLSAFALTNDYWAWLVLRAVFGCALTALFVMSEYWINAIAPPAHRGFVLGVYATVLAAGFAAGPAILALVGTSGSTPFMLGVALFAVAGVPVLLGARQAPALEQTPPVPLLVFLAAAPVATLAGLLHGAIETASMGLLPVYALQAGLGAETGAFLVSLFALGNVAFQLPIGFLSDRVDRRKLLLTLALLAACGASILPMARAESFPLFCGLLTGWGGVVGSLYVVGLAHLGARFKGAELASANAAFIMLYSIGMLAGPPIVGAGQDLLRPDGFFYSIALLLGVYLVLARQRLRDPWSTSIFSSSE